MSVGTRAAGEHNDKILMKKHDKVELAEPKTIARGIHEIM